MADGLRSDKGVGINVRIDTLEAFCNLLLKQGENVLHSYGGAGPGGVNT